MTEDYVDTRPVQCFNCGYPVVDDVPCRFCDPEGGNHEPGTGCALPDDHAGPCRTAFSVARATTGDSVATDL